MGDATFMPLQVWLPGWVVYRPGNPTVQGLNGLSMRWPGRVCASGMPWPGFFMKISNGLHSAVWF